MHFLLLITALIFSLYAQAKVKSAFSKYSKINSRKGYTAADIARRILNNYNLDNVAIEHVNGSLTDHYDPRTNVVRLSDTVYNSSSIAAIGVAAHECGHAVQHAMGYAPVRMRSALVPAVSFASNIVQWVLLAGVIFINVFPSFPLSRGIAI